MTYRIEGLDPAPYKPLFGLPDDELAERGVVRMTVTEPTFPCRVSLTDRALGEKVLLLNHVSHDVANPYRASHAIFVREGATTACDVVDRIPDVLRIRPISLRAFDVVGTMADAELVQGTGLEAAIGRLFAQPGVAYLHAHYATRGCYAARIDRS